MASAPYDAIIIGAGISGMYPLHRLRGLGLRARVFEAGDDVGGTWYWNRYPGARFDSESWTYGYSFDDEILDEWEWSEHFAAQPETLRYCNFVADKLDLRRDIYVIGRIRAAVWDEAEESWEIASDDGRRGAGALPDQRDRAAVGGDHAADPRNREPSRARPTTPRCGRTNPSASRASGWG